MMTQEQIFSEIRALSITEQIEIVEKISRNVRQKINESLEPSMLSDQNPTLEEKRAAIDRLRGIAKIENEPAPTDQEIREDYTNYLMEKYS